MLTSQVPNGRSTLRRLTQDTAPYRWLMRRRDDVVLRQWRARGHPAPPPHAFKRDLVGRVADQFAYKVFIETGTFHGDMTSAVARRFERVISIELDDQLFHLALRRFRRWPNVHLFHGDSAIALPRVLASIFEPCVFWLDAHYSGVCTARAATDTPILSELRAILAHKAQGHVILIDDARCFDGTHDYPSEQHIRALVARQASSYAVTISNDVIQIRPKAGMDV